MPPAVLYSNGPAIDAARQREAEAVVKDEAQGVAPGQRYRAAGSALSVWEVVSVARYPSEPLLHVQLVRVGHPNDRKTVALKVLRDKRYYQLVRQGEGG